MKFENWLICQLDRQDPVGDLARDWLLDGKVKPFTSRYLRSIGVSYDVLLVYREAKREFKPLKAFIDLMTANNKDAMRKPCGDTNS